MSLNISLSLFHGSCLTWFFLGSLNLTKKKKRPLRGVFRVNFWGAVLESILEAILEAINCPPKICPPKPLIYKTFVRFSAPVFSSIMPVFIFSPIFCYSIFCPFEGSKYRTSPVILYFPPPWYCIPIWHLPQLRRKLNTYNKMFRIFKFWKLNFVCISIYRQSLVKMTNY